MPSSVYISGKLSSTTDLGPFTKSLEVYGLKLAGLKEAGGNAAVTDEFIRKVAQIYARCLATIVFGDVLADSERRKFPNVQKSNPHTRIIGIS